MTKLQLARNAFISFMWLQFIICKGSQYVTAARALENLNIHAVSTVILPVDTTIERDIFFVRAAGFSFGAKLQNNGLAIDSRPDTWLIHYQKVNYTQTYAGSDLSQKAGDREVATPKAAEASRRRWRGGEVWGGVSPPDNFWISDSRRCKCMPRLLSWVLIADAVDSGFESH
jgi:hypothetical protein